MQTVAVDGQAGDETKRARSNALVGQYVLKEFEGNGIFLGKIMYYDGGLYRVDYEDGDCEDLESSELCSFIMEDAYFDDDLTERRKKLDELILKRKNISAMKLVESGNGVERVEASLVSDLSDVPIHEVDSVELDGEADSSSDSCEYARDREFGSDAETPMVPPPQLPPSSGNIGVPEEYVSHLFSVYGFLRSFSIRLFLSPFALDDLVGSLNCTVPNTLLDAIHVALLRVVRRHLEALSSSGLELASKCLWCIDWSLVDTLTWPVYLVQYLTIMGYTKGLELKGFYADVLDREYYTLSAGRKLIILKILCDDVLDSEELRAEIDIREESEIGIDPDSVTNFPPENGPRRVHPRYSKTSACKDQEAMQIIAESHETKLSRNSNSLGFKTTELDVNAADDQDVNGDECRLCGMDGTLLCCDGCPSVYHSRCIGVSKMFIPDGPWFCPECTIDKIGPTITVGTSLRGAEVFGIDAFEQVYLGTCNHLLVLKASIDAETCVRYYHQNDILKVIQVLYSSEQYAALYSGICKAILKYWEIKENVLLVPEIVEMDPTLANKKDGATIRPLSLPPPGIVNQKVLDTVVEGENCLSSITESNIKNVAVSCIETSWDTMTRTGYLGLQRNSDTTAKQICPLMIPKLPEQIKMESTMSTSSTSQQVDRSDLTQQSLADRSSGIDFATCLSGNSNSSNSGYMTGVCFPENLSSQSKSGNLRIVGRVKRNTVDDCTYMGAFFKSYAYINNYAHGDFAASAAANLAILSSEENRVSEVQASSNPRKVLSANISLQVKAFSSVANRFFWPNSEKKLVEVPRERCGWCLSCKASVSSKRGCLLNSAALNAIKGAMKILAGIRPLKNVEGNLPSIATYILYMEESLSGLVVGPFLSATCRKQWRRRVEQASTYSVIKALLLELEENIRIIALSGDWVKLVDNWLVEASVTQSATSATGSTQKRGPGRRSKRLSGVSEVADDRCLDKDFTWWRGGKLSKHIFQRGILPCSAVKKAARQGGSRKIPGICYAEVSEIPKRSRQVIWRAAVEMSKNASQLALQVRYLDLHIRWGDLVRPEQNIQDVKGPETEASAFRNAFICDKKIVENKIRYGVAFGNQKHLPSRVMKNIIEVEQIQDGNDKYWFYEMRIPLYLIKEYEESVETLLLSDKQPSNVLSKLQRLQLKASRRDIFSYLMRKRDNLDKCSCASCQLDVLLGSAVKCGACQGYCHEDCTISSTIQSTEEVEFLITCKQCYHAKTPTQNENSNDSPTSPLPLLGREYQNTATAPKGSRQKDYSQPLAYVRAPENCSNMQQTAAGSSLATKSRRKPCSWGLIWKKKNVEDSGIDFRLKNILLRGNPDTNWSRPVCHLCHQPYNSDLMYICCETCKNWYHAEAVELEESKILEVVGFKCCKCRRIRSPVCPYMDQELKKVEVKKPRLRTSKSGNPGMDSISGPIFEHLKEWEPNTPMSQTEEEVVVEDDDPLLFSRSRVEQITEHDTEVDFERNAAGPGPQKLPVRRHMKRENEVDGLSGNDQCQIESNHHLNTAELASSPHLEWDASIDGLEDEMIFDYENMEFEPQTYFSFTELLASDDGGQLDGIDASNWENLSYGISQDKVPEQCGMGTSCNQQQPTNFEEPAVNIMQCRMCSKTEPSPSLSCQICGLWIHSHCSPWVEESSWEDGWRCGNCREWR